MRSSTRLERNKGRGCFKGRAHRNSTQSYILEPRGNACGALNQKQSVLLCQPSAASGVARGMFNVSKKYVRFVKIVLLFKLKFKILHCSL